jgi:transglutaminase-like putative cysteine protease
MMRHMHYVYANKPAQRTAPNAGPFPFQFLGTPSTQGATHRVVETPYHGVVDSLDAMDKMARAGQTHPRVRRYAEEVIRQVYPKDYLSELAALYYDVCRRVRYTRDPAEREYVQHPVVVLQNRAADCDDQAVLIRASLAALGLSVGNPVEFVTVGFDPKAPRGRRFTHVFVRAFDTKSGLWIVLDPVAGPNTSDMLKKSRVFAIKKG